MGGATSLCEREAANDGGDQEGITGRMRNDIDNDNWGRQQRDRPKQTDGWAVNGGSEGHAKAVSF